MHATSLPTLYDAPTHPMHAVDKELECHDNTHTEANDEDAGGPDLEGDKAEESHEGERRDKHADCGHPRGKGEKEV